MVKKGLKEKASIPMASEKNENEKHVHLLLFK
jgi:hypothetical protein